MSVIEPELPFNIVVVTNLSGQPPAPLRKVKERRLIAVSRSSFPVLLASLKPQISVDNRQVFIKEVSPPSCEAIVAQLVSGGVSRDEAEALSHRVIGSTEYIALNASWRNLLFLVQSIHAATNTLVQVWNVSKKELSRDLQRAPEFDQSVFFKLIYEECLGTFGAFPVNLVILDFDIAHDPDDLELLEKVSQVGAASAAPVLIRVAPQFLELNSWKTLNTDLQARFFNRAPRRKRWCAIRGSANAPFVFAFLQSSYETEVGKEEIPAPTFMAAAAAARSFQGKNFVEVNSENEDWRCNELESHPPDSLTANLEAMGLNRVGLNPAEQMLLSAVCVEVPIFANRATYLREVLASCRIWHMLRLVVRNESPSHTRQIAAVQELVRSSEYTKRIASTNDIQVELLEHYGSLGLRFGFHRNDHGHPSSLEFHVKVATSSVQPEVVRDSTPHDSRPSIRVLVAFGRRADVSDKDRRAVTLTLSNAETVLEGAYNQYPFRFRPLPRDVQNDLLFSFSKLSDFTPEGLARFIPTCGALLEDRSALYDLASFADERTEGGAVLENARRRPGGVRALGSFVEAWVSVSANQGLSPVPATLITESLGSWISIDSSDLGWVPRALLRCEKWLERKPSYPSPSPGGFREALNEINELIDAQLRPIYRSEEFRTLEGTWRGLLWLVDTANNSDISVFELDWSSRLPNPICDVLREDWKYRREILGTFDLTSMEMRCVDIVVVDHCLSLESDIEVLRYFSDLWTKERLVTICGTTLDGRYLTQESHSLYEGLAAIGLGRGVILVKGDFVFKGAYENESSECSCPWQEGGYATHPIFSASAVYAVAAALSEVLQDFLSEDDAEARNSLLKARLADHGLTCAPFGNGALVVTDASFRAAGESAD